MPLQPSPAYAMHWRSFFTTKKIWSARWSQRWVDRDIESRSFALQADSEAYQGHLSKAKELTRRAVESARHDGDEETALTYAAIGTLREAEFGNRSESERGKSQLYLRMATDSKIQILELSRWHVRENTRKPLALST